MRMFSSLRSRVWSMLALIVLPLLVDALVVHSSQRAEALAGIEQEFARRLHAVLVEENRPATHAGLAGLEKLAAGGNLPSGWKIRLLAGDSQPMFGRPEPAGAGQWSESGRAALSHPFPGGGLAEMADSAGEIYLVATAPLQSIAGDLHIAIAAPKALVQGKADRDLLRRLLVLALAAGLALFIGRQLIQGPVGRWAEGVRGNLRRFDAGEPLVRRSEEHAFRELQGIEAGLDRLFEHVRQAGDSLREVRQEFDQVLECSGLASWEMRLPDGDKRCDERFARILGYAVGELATDQAAWRQRSRPDDMPAVVAALKSHLGGEQPLYECEYRLRHRQGHWLWVLERGWVSDRGADGCPLRMAGTAMDISRRKALEEEARQRGEELAVLLDAIPTPVWIARDRECRELIVSRAARGLDLPGAVGPAAAARGAPNPPADGEGGKESERELPMRRVIAEGRAVNACEVRLAGTDGQEFRLCGNAAPLFDEAGKVRGALAAFIDVTHLRAMAEILRCNEMILAQAEKMAHVGAWSIRLGKAGDFHGAQVFWSDETCRLLGYQPGEVVPDSELFMAHVHPEDRARLLAEVARARAGRLPYSAEYRIRRRDGAERVVLDRGEFHFDPSGSPLRCDGAIQDVTEQRLAEGELLRHRERLESLVAERTRELEMAKEAAERAGRSRSRFLANISHELRTPLNSLMLLAHVLSSNSWENLNSQQLEYARLIESAGADLVQLIDELLDLSRIESGRPEVRVRAVPFPDIMQNVRRLYRHVARAKGLDFRMEIAPDVPAGISTDPLRLQQILRNLIFNAVQFTDAGSVTLRIRRAVSGWHFGSPALAAAETVVAFDVVDTGIGISPERQGWVFELLGQEPAAPDEDPAGRGLGLSIAREIATLLGGELALASAPGQGSTFTLYLPLENQAAPSWSEPPARVGGDQAGAVPATLAGKRVLIVDDDERNRFALGALLEQQGVIVHGVAGGPEAIRLLAGQQVDLVLMDILMPGIDGCQATRAIRAEISRSLPIIALTSSALPGVREDCQAAGCTDYLVKPIDNALLLARVQSCLAAAEGLPGRRPVAL